MEIEATGRNHDYGTVDGRHDLDELKQRRPFLDLTARQQFSSRTSFSVADDKIFSVSSRMTLAPMKWHE